MSEWIFAVSGWQNRRGLIPTAMVLAGILGFMVWRMDGRHHGPTANPGRTRTPPAARKAVPSITGFTF